MKYWVLQTSSEVQMYLIHEKFNGFLLNNSIKNYFLG